ncbi:MAG: RNA-directed DNA polymerase [Kiritimatiellae bacterium]|nr:RNA-directed DNA polymerase [Kiritimatiellia bacterium]MCO5044427.1 RNA-directed DNA polymerase [Kiritimatiellia bacterium]MCO5068450.1 RNA-directed DNA polymerase [Kiritimatiellia bacterium]
MKRLIDNTAKEAKKHFLKGSSYFNSDFPSYISFEKLLTDVEIALAGGSFMGIKERNPGLLPNVNYSIVANKDGRLSWRPFELIHPVLYVSLVNQICEPTNWALIVNRMKELEGGLVDCCSAPVMSVDANSDKAAQVKSWWQGVEQKSLVYSLNYSHLLHTDVTDCYGSLYTHSIAWAIHGIEASKESRGKNKLLGDVIDSHMQAGRYGQTNGIPQGSVMMDFIAEIVLGFVDDLITKELARQDDFRILRYRDDYRIFAQNDQRAEQILKVVSDKLRVVGMRLGVSKTMVCANIVEGSIKPDKQAGIDLQDLGNANAKTIQKQLLRLHAFGRRFPNSGALRRLAGELHEKISEQKEKPEDLEVQVAIATDIAIVSPLAFPAIAGILSCLISFAEKGEKERLWSQVLSKMRRIPYNGYLEIWLQRVSIPQAVGIQYESDEPICQIVKGLKAELWENGWIASKEIKSAVDASKIVIADATKKSEVVKPDEVALFTENAWMY